ncbi:polygalacturonase-like [Gastrolobium bilobum]|uniref:polygalacturonase-like n=1 Tax=Gastrolobium bilobum TaxID=150636 RepID=UPI002AAFC64A|nr:polygalacturonase-like [Gastrolobium bilobum]
MTHHTNYFIFLFLVTLSFFFEISNGSFINVVSYGAKPDGKSDSTMPFLRAWSSACKSNEAATIYVPQGSFLLKQVTFWGPCMNKIHFRIDGTIVAPSDYWSLGNSGYWILFMKLNGLSIYGGTLDGKGAGYWHCRKAGQSCTAGARSISFSWSNNVVVSGLKSLNSQAMHIAIDHCKNVLIQNVKIRAPSGSPNTDGINVQFSSGVTISHAIIMTGDDCISINQGTTNLWIEHISCGPGHGISIGSLGTYSDEAGVENVTVSNSVFTRTENGVRIKSWPQASNGYARDIVFRNLIMQNAHNPIIIDQRYCPGKECPHQSSGVEISRVSYEHIRGTSASPVAMNFDCSQSNPCWGIKLQDIKLINNKGSQTSSCTNAGGSSTGVIIPRSCL